MKTDNIIADSETTPVSQIAESLRNIRGEVIDQSARMATYAPTISTEITDFATNILNTVSKFEGQMMSAESLYRPLRSDESVPSGIARIYKVINEYDKYLVNAIQIYEDEVARETEMTLFRRMPFELDYINIGGSNIGEVGTALKVALLGNVTKPCTLEQIIALRKILDFIKKDISVRETTIMEILSILDDQFGLAGPLAEVDIIG
ncbi:MAG: hypothetical protein HZA15_07805 [Nitrospirae bacterium]|nr:hypothetical protein [Nitrospirota bacterium]